MSRGRGGVGSTLLQGLAEGVAFAQRMAVADSYVFAIPDAISDREAAALHVTYQTSHMALVERARLQAGETLLREARPLLANLERAKTLGASGYIIKASAIPSEVYSETIKIIEKPA